MAALGSPEGHGTSIDAFIDSMSWGGMNKVEPPYKVRIANGDRLPDAVIAWIKLLKVHLADQREYFRNQEGHDIDVELEIVENEKTGSSISTPHIGEQNSTFPMPSWRRSAGGSCLTRHYLGKKALTYKFSRYYYRY